MTVIGLDDTDSRSLGMCTTYVATSLAETLAADGASVERLLLVRLHPGIEHKTRGNAALALHTDADPTRARVHVERILEMAADDEQTNPGAVVADCPPETVPTPVVAFASRAVRERLTPAEAHNRVSDAGFQHLTRGTGRGVVGALAAVGAWRAFEEWTCECISYRERERWGTPREVDHDSVVAAADRAYPDVWDTVDRGEDETVCVPRTPCPVLHGIRGETAAAVRTVAEQVESEPVARRQVFLTNQGTDAHLQRATLDAVDDGGCYRVDLTVLESPRTQRGGHVFGRAGPIDADWRQSDNGSTIRIAAFEPTKRFRDRVRALRPGDRITACGEVSDGTLKLEKFAVRDLVRSERVTPDCPGCGRSMESAGQHAGYRCRDCDTRADGKVEQPVVRDIEHGWYEVPPCARRHIAKPLVRGGFDAPTHSEW